MSIEVYFGALRSWVRERVEEAHSGDLDLSVFESPGVHLDKTDLVMMYVLEADSISRE